MPKTVVAVIVTFQRKALLSEVIDAVCNQSFPVTRIIVVDNNSNDGTAELVTGKANNAPAPVEYHDTGKNVGGAGGFSYGMRVAVSQPCDFLWLLEDDCRPEAHCLHNLMRFAGDRIVCQPTRMNPDGTCAELSPITYDLQSWLVLRPKRKSVVDIDDWEAQEIIPLQGVPFEGPLLPARLIDDIGFPDARFFIFHDDLEYCLKARLQGYEIVCIPDARATRLLEHSRIGDLGSWKGYFMLRNFFRIHRLYGENIVVRKRPLFITVAFVIRALFTKNLKAASVCLDAYRDHKTRHFVTDTKYIPK